MDVICKTVTKLKADTLVMGSHGYGFFKRCVYMSMLMIHFFLMLLGSYCIGHSYFNLQGSSRKCERLLCQEREVPSGDC